MEAVTKSCFSPFCLFVFSPQRTVDQLVEAFILEVPFFISLPLYKISLHYRGCHRDLQRSASCFQTALQKLSSPVKQEHFAK